MDIFEPTLPDEHRRALGLLMARPDSTPQQIESQIDTLVAYSQSYGLSLKNLLVMREQGEPIAACLCVDSPGRISSVFLPATTSDESQVEASRLLLLRAGELAAQRGIQLLQAMQEPEARIEAELLAAAGFERIAQLLYLERDLAAQIGPAPPMPDLHWEFYTDAQHIRFLRVLQGTYDDSLDCPALNGRRGIEDIVASHRAAGQFDPKGWVIAMKRDEPVGLVLVNQFPERLASEIVYMGVLPSARQQGYGRAVLRQAIRVAREQGSLTLALSVDEVNTPARKLYGRFAFQETARRSAWIRFLS